MRYYRHLELTTSTTAATSATVWYNQFVTGVRKIVVGSNLVTFFLFTPRVAEDLVVNGTSSKAKKSYS